MYLKSLDIHGFKSFADKTKFEFHPHGVTGIVGPNGCGKSNVVDSIRWVLGETSAKALRGGEMADVIFKGTDKTGKGRARAASGMAEVTMTLADCEEALKIDYNEVAITRRVYRDGKSEYRINNTLCRLRDIHELFMDTGIGRTSYSIMEQGKIDMLLSSKPEDRRMVFEEAAGITKFKKEKKEALRKLEYTEVNLLRISDVLAEQERRINSLKRQVAKARRYQALAQDVTILDTHWSHRKYLEYRAELSTLENSIHALEVRECELEDQLPAKESAVVEARDAAQSLEAELSEIRHQLNHHTNAASSAESRIAFNRENQAELEARVEQNRLEIEEAKGKLNQQQVDFEVAEKLLVDLSERIEAKQAQLSEFESRAATQRAEREEKEAVLRSVRNEANTTQAIIAASQAKIESAMSQVENSRERSRKLSEEYDRLQAEHEKSVIAHAKMVADLEAWHGKLATLQDEKEAAERAFQHTRGDVDSARKSADSAHKELTQVSSRRDVLRQLVESGEGFEKGTQSVLKGLDEPEFFKNGVRGVLAGLIEVERDYTLAVESVLGANLQAVLVTDSVYTQAIIDRLTLRKLGKAALIEEDFVATKGTLERQRLILPDGAEAWAMDRVKFDPKVGSVVESLLANVLVVRDLTTALELRKDPQLCGVTLVTMRGEVCRPDGIIRGGAGKGGQSSVLDRQNEVRTLEEKVAELERVDEEMRVKLSRLEQQLSEQRELADLARERLQQAKVEESTLKGQLTLTKREVESFQSKLTSVEWEINDIKQRESHANDGLEEFEEDLATGRSRFEQLEMEQIRLVGELEEASRRESEAVATLQEFRTSLAVERQAQEAAERQRSPMAARLEELRQISMRRDEEIVGFSKRIQKAKAENETLLEAAEMHRAEARDLEELLETRSASRGALHEVIQVSEKALAELRHDFSKIAEQKGKDEVASTKVGLRLENLTEQVMERHQIEVQYFKPNHQALMTCLRERGKAHERNQLRHGESSDRSWVSGRSGGNENGVDSDAENAAPDWKLVESLVTDLKRKLDSMGPVNVDAIEEYDELEALHNDLRTQHDDLVSSKTELVQVIEKINVETKKRFTATFEQVTENFKGMFKVLFGEKAVANLVLMDESDPLESGIDIIAKPPGKKLQSITLLSGGERSMTAVALLFSIFQIKPSPFCVLDELDAPLDEANIGRFLKVLDQFIDQSQFIIVTHSKRTMQRADVIYGVTMEDFGVSKPVGMRLTSAENADKGEARTAAQKAALELDA